jgi:hypothetical protein
MKSSDFGAGLKIQAICREKNFRKIQSICNGKCAPITMQGLARARKKPPTQEQWQTIEKTMRRAIGTVGHPGERRRPVGRRKTGDGAARESPPSGMRRFAWHPRDLSKAMKMPADEQRRAIGRTNPRLGFQPSPILPAKASERKKRSRYPC